MGDLFEVLVLGGARQGNGPRRFVGNVRRPQQPQEMPEGDPREHLVHVLLNNLAGGVGLNQLFNLAGFGNAMHGNLGDYVLNQEGLAAIANQLFVEAEERGPPPMPEEELSKLPTVRVTKESIDRDAQCSVCMERFNLDESVLKLICDHLFHPPCIVPWLKLNSSCPTCRRPQLGDDGEGSGSSHEGGAGGESSGGVPPRRGSRPRSGGQTPSSGQQASSSSATSDRGGGGAADAGPPRPPYEGANALPYPNAVMEAVRQMFWRPPDVSGGSGGQSSGERPGAFMHQPGRPSRPPQRGNNDNRPPGQQPGGGTFSDFDLE